jgi:hypothetical protein
MNNQVFAPGQPGYTIPNKPKDWFSYPANFLSLANAATQSTNLQIDAGSDFFLTAISFFAINTASTAVVTADQAPIPNVTLLITDSGSNRQLMQNPVPLWAIAGDGNHPHRLIHPRLFMRNSNIQLQMTSRDTTATFSIYLNFEGFRVYNS